MTDPKTEWRDEEGRVLRPHTIAGSDLYFAGELECAALTEADARFLLRYLPEALGEKRFVSGKQVYEHYGVPALPTDPEDERIVDELVAKREVRSGPLPGEQSCRLAFKSWPVEKQRAFLIGLTNEHAYYSGLEHDRAIVAAAERHIDQQRARYGKTMYESLESGLASAVDAKRAALKEKDGG